jgi:hypothetical protein
MFIKFGRQCRYNTILITFGQSQSRPEFGLNDNTNNTSLEQADKYIGTKQYPAKHITVWGVETVQQSPWHSPAHQQECSTIPSDDQRRNQLCDVDRRGQ